MRLLVTGTAMLYAKVQGWHELSMLYIMIFSFIHLFIHSNFKQVNSIKQNGIETIIVN